MKDSWPFLYLDQDNENYFASAKPFFNSSTSTFLITGLALNCLILITLAFWDCLFLFNFLFKVVTAISIPVYDSNEGQR